jgi:hypothetical protein
LRRALPLLALLGLLGALSYCFAGDELSHRLAACKKQGAEGSKAADEVVAHHAGSAELEGHVRTLSDAWFSGGGVAAVESGLKTLMAKTPHRTVRAAAMFQLAQWFFGVDTAEKAKRLEACDLLDAIAKDYADCPCAKEAAEYAALHTRALAAKEHVVKPHPPEALVVGKVAPDFEAEDQDGVAFKLSDYRGKVVALDFWGFW